MFFKVTPQPCGSFGRKTLYGGELTDRPPQIYRFHFEFESTPLSEISGINSTYIGSEELMERIKELFPRATGITFDEVFITATAEFRKQNPGRELPHYKWFKVIGKAKVDDFGISEDHELYVSDRIFALLQ